MLINRDNAQAINKEVIAKIILTNDLSTLSNTEKCDYIHHMCQNLGLNMITQPIKLLKLQGKETLYMTKDGTEQLRALHKISIAKLEREVIGDVYVVTAYAENDTRRDSSTGAVSIKGLAGDSLANAYMKAETKAKRRATLSICGLGMLDESEIDTIKDAQIISVQEVKLLDDNEIKDILEKIKTSFYEESKTIEHLRKSFAEFKRYYPQLSEQIIELAQYRAAELNQPQKQIEDNSQGE